MASPSVQSLDGYCRNKFVICLSYILAGPLHAVQFACAYINLHKSPLHMQRLGSPYVYYLPKFHMAPFTVLGHVASMFCRVDRKYMELYIVNHGSLGAW